MHAPKPAPSINDHFRPRTPPPKRGGLVAALVAVALLAGGVAGIGAVFWLASTRGADRPGVEPAPSLLAQRQAEASAEDPEPAVVPQRAAAAARRAESAAAAAAAVLPAAEMIAAVAPAPAAAPAARPAPDSGERTLADQLGQKRQELDQVEAWLAKAQRDKVVEAARAQLARAKEGTARFNAQVALNNLLGTIAERQREAKRLQGLVDTAERRLAAHQAKRAAAAPAAATTRGAVDPFVAPPGAARRAQPPATTPGAVDPFVPPPR